MKNKKNLTVYKKHYVFFLPFNDFKYFEYLHNYTSSGRFIYTKHVLSSFINIAKTILT